MHVNASAKGQRSTVLCECVDKSVNVSTISQRYEVIDPYIRAAGSDKRSVTQPTCVLMITSNLDVSQG